MCVRLYDTRCFSLAEHFNRTNHSLMNPKCIILKGNFLTTADRLICVHSNKGNDSNSNDNNNDIK